MELMKYPSLWLWLNVTALAEHWTGKGNDWDNVSAYCQSVANIVKGDPDKAEDLYNAAKSYCQRYADAGKPIPSRAFIHAVMVRMEFELTRAELVGK